MDSMAEDDEESWQFLLVNAPGDALSRQTDDAHPTTVSRGSATVRNAYPQLSCAVTAAAPYTSGHATQRGTAITE